MDGLVDSGVVERRLSREDARVKQLYLTEQGTKMREMSPEVLGRIDQRLSEGFSAAEMMLLKDWLQRVVHNLEQTD